VSKRKPSGNTARLFEPRFFKALCDPARLAVVRVLAARGESCSVSELAERCCPGLDLSVVSRHLAKLRDAGILGCERSGKEVRYFVRMDSIVGTLRAIADLLETASPTGKGKKKSS
jgi:ArsR family transcriptional regulator